MALYSHKEALVDPVIYCKTERKSLESRLSENWFEGLLALNDAILRCRHGNAMDQALWHNSPEIKFYEWSFISELSFYALNDAMREAPGLIETKNRNERLKSDYPQLFVPSKKGFCPKYLKDITSSPVTTHTYLLPRRVWRNSAKTQWWLWMDYLKRTLLNLECQWVHCNCWGKNAFVVDLPMDIQVPQSTIFSLCIVTAKKIQLDSSRDFRFCRIHNIWQWRNHELLGGRN